MTTERTMLDLEIENAALREERKKLKRRLRRSNEARRVQKDILDRLEIAVGELDDADAERLRFIMLGATPVE